MTYVFEKGTYPKLTEEKDFEFETNEEAINFAKENNWDHVWYVPDIERNPETLYSRPHNERIKNA